MRLALPVLAVCAFVLVACGDSTAATSPATGTASGTPGSSKATICGKALGSVALNEVSDAWYGY